MIEAIRNIGMYALEKNNKSTDSPLEILLDNPANRYTKNVLLIILDGRNEEFIYHGIEVEKYSKEKLEKYLYKKGAPRGTDITPTSMVTDIEKTFDIKILSWFKKYCSGGNGNKEMIQNIFSCLRKNQEQVIGDLKENSTMENNVISFKINGKYLGEYEVFRNILVNSATEKFYKRFGKISKSENQFCSVCQENKKEVFGFVSSFNFYTVDKRGFVSGGFRQENAWKNYPVCLNCALTLEEGRKYLEDYLNFNFYGFKYLLIPKFFTSLSGEIQKDIFRSIEEQKDPKFREKEIRRLTNAENEILSLMSEEKNYFNNNFLFYRAPKGFSGSVFNILLYIEDILPSRLRTLFEVKEKVDQEEIFKNHMISTFNKQGKKDGEMLLEFDFGILRTFFPKISTNRTFDKYFLNLVNNIFIDKPIKYDFLLNYIILKIRDDFLNGYPTKTNTLRGFMLLNFLYRLGILKFKEGIRPMGNRILPEEIGGERKEKIELFFQKFPDFFNSDIKKAIFLEGVLAQFLLNIQYRERRSNPFRVKLKGLKLDEKQIRKLLPEIQNKLEEYGKNYYRDLETIISFYLVSSGNDWNIANDEISFYFVLGMNLSELFKKERESGGNENEQYYKK
jgi:CRISPR-associated protein Csh1